MSDLTREFGREHITVWGNRSSEIVEKCYRQVSYLLVFFVVYTITKCLLTVMEDLTVIDLNYLAMHHYVPQLRTFSDCTNIKKIVAIVKRLNSVVGTFGT